MEAGHRLVDFASHVNNVAVFLHLDAQQQALLAVVLDVAFRRGVFFSYIGHVFQAYVPSCWVGVYDCLLDVIHRVERLLHVDWFYRVACLHASTCGDEALLRQRHGQRVVAQAVVGEAFVVNVYGDLFLPHAAHGHAPHAFYASQAVLECVHVVG